MERNGSGPMLEGTEVREESDEMSSSMLRPLTMRGWMSVSGGSCGDDLGTVALTFRCVFVG